MSGNCSYFKNYMIIMGRSEKTLMIVMIAFFIIVCFKWFLQDRDTLIIIEKVDNVVEITQEIKATLDNLELIK